MDFSRHTTKAMSAFLAKEGPAGSGRVVGLSIEPDGVFIYTESAKWCDGSGAGTFRADSETAAIAKFYARVRAAEPAPAERKPVRTIDMTPTWQEITPTLLMGFENGNAKGRAIALEELQRMAKLADIASVILGSHRRPDAPAEPDADKVRTALTDAAALLRVYTSPSGRDGPNASTRGQALATVRQIEAVMGETVAPTCDGRTTLNGYALHRVADHENGIKTVAVHMPENAATPYCVATWWRDLGDHWNWGHYVSAADLDATFLDVSKRNAARASYKGA